MQGWTADDYEVGCKGKAAADFAEDPVKPDDAQHAKDGCHKKTDGNNNGTIVQLDTKKSLRGKTAKNAEEGGLAGGVAATTATATVAAAAAATRELAVDPSSTTVGAQQTARTTAAVSSSSSKMVSKMTSRI